MLKKVEDENPQTPETEQELSETTETIQDTVEENKESGSGLVRMSEREPIKIKVFDKEHEFEIMFGEEDIKNIGDITPEKKQILLKQSAYKLYASIIIKNEIMMLGNNFSVANGNIIFNSVSTIDNAKTKFVSIMDMNTFSMIRNTLAQMHQGVSEIIRANCKIIGGNSKYVEIASSETTKDLAQCCFTEKSESDDSLKDSCECKGDCGCER